MLGAKQTTFDMYASLMEEVKLREAMVCKFIAGEFTLLHRCAREYCFLQIRMIIEMMSLGCLSCMPISQPGRATNI